MKFGIFFEMSVPRPFEGGIEKAVFEHALEQARLAERLRPRLLSFHPEGWGDRHLDPYHPVSASVVSASITLPPIRFVCRPDVLAFEGTERV